MDPTRARPVSPGLGEFATAGPSPRAALVASLAETLTGAVALGDEEVARVIHDAIGRLRGLSAGPEGRARSRRWGEACRDQVMAVADPHRRAEEQAPFPAPRPLEACDLLNQPRLTTLRERLSRVARLLKMPTESAFPRLRLERRHLAHVL